MVTVADMRKKWDRVDVLDYTADAMLNHEREILDLNKGQLNKGENAKAERITPDYSPSTIKAKQAEGREWRFVTLRDTGSFQNLMEINVVGSSFVIDSTDSKTGDLKAKYGEDILGLSPESKTEAWLITKPDVIESIRKTTGSI